MSGYSFSRVPSLNMPRSKFTRSHNYKTTLNAGYLVPFYVDEALPGDTFNLKVSVLARMATPIDPLMDNIYMDIFFFAVPNRLVWEHWEQFNGQRDSPADYSSQSLTDYTNAYLIPQMTAPTGGYTEMSLEDYFGLPTKVAGYSHTALFHRAYNLIWNEWFRDENLQQPVAENFGDGPDSPSDYSLLRRGKRHDYFTSALPWPQKGPGVELPLGTSAPVLGNGKALLFSDGTNLAEMALGSNSGAYFMAPRKPISAGNDAIGTTDTTLAQYTTGNMLYGVIPDGTKSGLVADLSSATAATINSLRTAFQIQKIFERDARGGTRYTEILRSHFNVISPDARLQRPEFLGGSSVPVVINPVVQTSATETGSGKLAATPQGNLAAYAVAGCRDRGFVKSFTEHTIILGLVSFRADLTYQQGLNRMWSRKTRWDFYWPSLAHLGEQAILNKEIYTQGTAGSNASLLMASLHLHEIVQLFDLDNIYIQHISPDTQKSDHLHLSLQFLAYKSPYLKSPAHQDGPNSANKNPI